MGMRLVSVTLPEKYLEGLEELVRQGRYPNRSAAIRIAVRDLLLRELWNCLLYTSPSPRDRG